MDLLSQLVALVRGSYRVGLRMWVFVSVLLEGAFCVRIFKVGFVCCWGLIRGWGLVLGVGCEC